MNERSGTETAPAKVLAPDTSVLERRTGLLAQLRPIPERAIVWIDGPPGAGKTSLAAQGLAAFAGSRMWLRVDPGDADAANFFHFLHIAAVAAGLNAAGLPRFGPEYDADPSAFARLFLRACSALGDWCLVLDNLDATPPGMPPHDLLNVAREARSTGSLVVVTSRLEPGTELARLQVEGALTRLAADTLRLTPDEAVRLAHRAGTDWTDEAIERARERSSGWVAGFLLMLTFAGKEESTTTPDSNTPRVLFDYLEREFLSYLPRATVELLGQLAPLESVPVGVVEALAGVDGIERLDVLARRGAFVALETASGSRCYRLHPLLCEFLEGYLSRNVASATRREWHGRNGDALAATGDPERAVDAWLAGHHYERAAAALLRLAPQQLAAGRVQATRQRLAALPAATREAAPWLRLWHATATIQTAPADARRELLSAYQTFRVSDDHEGAALAWAATAESLWVEWGNFREFDWLADELDWLAKNGLTGPTRGRLAPQAVLLLAIVEPETRKDAIEEWIGIARRTSTLADVEPGTQLTILHTLLTVHVWIRGAREDGDNTIAHGSRLEATAPLPPLQRLMWRGAVAGYRLWFADDPREAIAEAERGLELARATDMHQWDFQLNALAASGAIAAGDIERADVWLAAMETSGRPDCALDASFHAWITGWAAIRKGDTSTALARAHKAYEDLLQGGPWNAVNMTRLAVAQAEHRAGNTDAAREHLREIRPAARRAGAGIHRWLAALTRARLLLATGNMRQSRRLLRATLTLGRRNGYLRLPWWTPDEIAMLCEQALHAGSPSAYLRSLAAANGLTDWCPPMTALDWPWPIRVHTLGGLRVQVDDMAVELSGKGAELLHLLVTESTEGVDQARVTDSLWPDAEGDRARRSLDTTLHRLRQRLGHSDAIRMQGGQIDLNPTVVWTDVHALEQHLDNCAQGSEAAWQGVVSLVGNLHTPRAGRDGSASQRLIRRLVRMTEEQLIKQLEAGRNTEALRLVEVILAVDNTAENLCQLGLTAAARIGDPTRALHLYRCCVTGLDHNLGTRPSSRTDALYRKALTTAGNSRST